MPPKRGATLADSDSRHAEAAARTETDILVRGHQRERPHTARAGGAAKRGWGRGHDCTAVHQTNVEN